MLLDVVGTVYDRRNGEVWIDLMDDGTFNNPNCAIIVAKYNWDMDIPELETRVKARVELEESKFRPTEEVLIEAKLISISEDDKNFEELIEEFVEAHIDVLIAAIY